MSNRYFLVTYSYDHSENKSGIASLTVESEKFPSQKELRKAAYQQSGILGDACRIFITGWHEFNNQEDYEAFRN